MALQKLGHERNACRTDVAREGEAISLWFDTAWSEPLPIFNEVPLGDFQSSESKAL